MTHLMKLELKKISLKKYILFSILGILATMFFILVGLNDSSSTIYDYKVTFQMTGIVFCSYYIILFAVSNVTYIINEYTNKTILVLFSYPVNKRRLILSKLILVLMLMSISMAVGYICCCTFIIVVDKNFNLVIGDFHISILSYWIPAALKEIIMFCSLGTWSFIIGMIRKSIPVTLVSSIVLIYVRQLLLAGTNATEENWLLVLLVAVITAAGVYYTLAHKVVKID